MFWHQREGECRFRSSNGRPQFHPTADRAADDLHHTITECTSKKHVVLETKHHHSSKLFLFRHDNYPLSRNTNCSAQQDSQVFRCSQMPSQLEGKCRSTVGKCFLYPRRQYNSHQMPRAVEFKLRSFLTANCAVYAIMIMSCLRRKSACLFSSTQVLFHQKIRSVPETTGFLCQGGGGLLFHSKNWFF